MFTGSIKCESGPYPDWEEAVEAALQYANDDPEPPTRVLLIGDAPPHRQHKGQSIPGQARPDSSNLQPGAGLAGQVLSTDYRIEADKLSAKAIKVALRIVLSAFPLCTLLLERFE